MTTAAGRILSVIESAPAPEGGDERAKELSDLLCPVHANLDKNDHLEPFDNCIACIRVERDELNKLIQRISTDIAQTIIEDPIKSAEGWVMMSQPILKDIQSVCEGLHKIALAKFPAPEEGGDERAKLFELLKEICRNAYACAYQQNTFPGESEPCGKCANCLADKALGENWEKRRDGQVAWEE